MNEQMVEVITEVTNAIRAITELLKQLDERVTVLESNGA